MKRISWHVAMLAVLATIPATEAAAHCLTGARFFPATLNVDDPCVADELSFPTVSVFKNGDVPSAWQTDISGEFSKRITETFGVSIGPTWSHIRPPGGPNASGFQNLETTFKWQFLTVPEQEFVMSVALNIEWGGSGAAAVGAEPVTSYTPTLFFGKGFGGLPDEMRWMRPFAITGQIGYAIPAQSTTTTFDSDSGTFDVENNPNVLVWGGSIQYSMPYLKSNVADLGLPDIINRLVPIVEASLETPVTNTLTSGTVTTGTINPGVIYVGDKFQVGVEAIIPVNSASGSGIGVIGQLHFYLDDIFPNSIGRPLFGGRPRTGI
jgi:hypothetical protein